MTYRNQSALNKWLTDAPPQAIGPLLYALIAVPQAFDATVSTPEGGQTMRYSEIDCHYLQQQAIDQITAWLAEKTGESQQRKTQFVESCKRMSKLGSVILGHDDSYCKNRLSLDLFMRTPVKRLFITDSDKIRKQYLENANYLGSTADKACRSMRL